MNEGRCGLGFLLCAALAGCSKSESKPTSAAADSGAGGAGGALSFPYTPDGCGYTVALPDAAEDATGHIDAMGAAPEPKHIHVSWAGPSESSFAVNWTTDVETRIAS